MSYFVSSTQSIPIFHVRDLFDEVKNRLLLADIEQHIDKGSNRFIVDMSHINVINSIGLNLLIGALKKCEQSGGAMTVAGPSKSVLKLLEITKLRKRFSVSTSLEEALKYIRKN